MQTISSNYWSKPGAKSCQSDFKSANVAINFACEAFIQSVVPQMTKKICHIFDELQQCLQDKKNPASVNNSQRSSVKERRDGVKGKSNSIHGSKPQ
jgi:hypothetical protein